MILLLQPPRLDGRVTGGYRYNGELIRRLESTGLGQLREVAPEELEPFAHGTGCAALVLDSLYLTTTEPPAWIQPRSGSPLSVLLLHYLPSLDPTLTHEERERLAAREARWITAIDRLVTTSASLGETVRQKYGRQVELATPGVDSFFRPESPPASSPRPAGIPEVISIGTIIPAKGQLPIARALSACAAAGAPSRLVLVGDANADPAYVRQVQAAATGVELVLAGTTMPVDVVGRMRHADLFVSASLFESYGMAVAEAIATKIPVVAYDTGEIGRWIHEGENGYLIENGDEPTLARTIQDLVTRPERLAALRGNERTTFFPSWEYTFERFLRAVRVPTGTEGVAPFVALYSRCELPTQLGVFAVEVYRLENEEEALLIHLGDVTSPEPLFVRVHSECFTGEILGSLKCDCRMQLDLALAEIAERGRGAVVYLRQEGRGIGLGNKIRAYAEQAKGADTIEANETLGYPADLRDFRVAALMLEKKGVRRIVLNTNNPNKVASLEANGIEVQSVVPSSTTPNPHNRGYLETKYHELGHAGLEHALQGIGALPHAGSGVATALNGGGARKPLVLFDLDGVLQLDDTIPEQARALVAGLRAEGYPLRFLTNDGINSRATRLAELSRLGLEIELDELYTAAHLTARYISERGAGPILPLCGHPALDEFEGLEIAREGARTVVIGDYFPHYDYDTIKSAYDALAGGAELVAMHRKRSWPTAGKRVIDIGFWVAGLEFCAGRPATVVGKPSLYSYGAVLGDAGYLPGEALMISDESDPDLVGARKVGLGTLLFHEAGTDTGPDAGALARSYGEIWESVTGRSAASLPS